MLRKILIVMIMLIASSASVFASETVPYLGINVGGDTGTLKLQDTAGNTTNYHKNGALVGLFAGMGTNVEQNVYAGLELFATDNSSQTGNKQISSSNGPAQTKINLSYTFGLSLIPGYKFTDATMLYARIGVIRGRYNVHQTVVPSNYTSNTARYTSTGAEIGLGFEADVTMHWGVRVEYDYVGYRTFTAFGNKIRPRDNQYSLGLLYKFC